MEYNFLKVHGLNDADADGKVGAASRFYKEVGDWLIAQPDISHQHRLIVLDTACVNTSVLTAFTTPYDLGDGWSYSGAEAWPCPLISEFQLYQNDRKPAWFTGARRVTFTHSDGSVVTLYTVSFMTFSGDSSYDIEAFACVPSHLEAQWIAWVKECERLRGSAVHYRNEIYVVGGYEPSFGTTVTLDDVYLPQTLKDDIMLDIQAFFERGVQIYERLNLRPFRKLLLAGVPGTGKTMLCSALARWALGQGIFVLYVSGSSVGYGSRFYKVTQALDMAASSGSRALVIVEELDAFMGDEEGRSEMLNVLDGMESPRNPHGTVIISTTNHPELIDDRVLKRPGRLDRIFIIPQMEDASSAEKMLRAYLGDQWREEHSTFIPKLLGQSGAFIREVALYTMTHAAYRGDEVITLEALEKSYGLLQQQIDAKDDFLKTNNQLTLGFGGKKRSGRHETPF